MKSSRYNDVLFILSCTDLYYDKPSYKKANQRKYRLELQVK